MIQIDRRHFIASLGGAAAVARMSHEAKAEALEEYLVARTAPQSGEFPTAAEIESQIPTRHYRRGAGNLFLQTVEGRKVERLSAMPERPTIQDFFEHRFQRTRNHCFQSANRAMETGQSEEVILACLLHDTVQELIKVDHGYWGAQLYEPYVPERTSWAIRYHQALRFYADDENGYVYPDLYHRIFGHDYVPEPYIQQAEAHARGHAWYMDARMVTVSDLYAFEPGVTLSIDPFLDILGRHFKQPAEGLGYDQSPVAHMWRSIQMPDNPL